MRNGPIVLLLALGACDAALPVRTEAPLDSVAGQVAFELVGPNEAALVVPVRINGREPVKFVLDTGATLTCVDEALARELGLPDQKARGGVAIGALTAGRLETVMMDTLRIGNAAAFGLIACKLDLATLRKAFGAQGLVGLNFLKSFDMSLDFESKVLTLRAQE